MLTLGLILAVFGGNTVMEAEKGEYYLVEETNEEPKMGEIIVGSVGELIVYDPHKARIIVGQVDRIEVGGKEPSQAGTPTYKIVRGKVTMKPLEMPGEEVVSEPKPPD